ncbi:MAG: hypothetical protein ACMZ63_06485 [Methylotenera sp.]
MSRIDYISQGALVLALFCWLIMVFQYSLVELYRPYVVCVVIVSVSALVPVIYGVLAKKKIRVFFNNGLLIGLIVSLLFLVSNFLIKQPVETPYEIINVHDGRANATTWDVKIGNQVIKLSTYGYPTKQQKLELFKGLWGYYYADKV